MVSASRSDVCASTSGASTSRSTSKRRVLRRSTAVAPCRPSKPIFLRTMVVMPSRGLGRRGFLLHLALDDLALDRADHVDEQARDQVVVLVLQGPPVQRLALDRERLALD